MKTEDYIASLERMHERMWGIYMDTRDDPKSTVAYEMAECFEEGIKRLHFGG